MIQWVENLYVGERLAKKKDSVMASIENREATFNIYCISFATSSANLFDIMDVNQLLYPHYKKANIKIVGLAKGKKEALQMVEEMLLKIYNETGGFDVRTYFT